MKQEKAMATKKRKPAAHKRRTTPLSLRKLRPERTIEELAKEQGIKPFRFDEVAGRAAHLWPTDEALDAFVAATHGRELPSETEDGTSTKQEKAMPTQGHKLAARKRRTPPQPHDFWREPTLEELAKEQGVKPVRFEEVFGKGADLWESDEDFEDFLAACKGQDRKGP